MILRMEPATNSRRAFRWMRQRHSHPPFVVKIDAGCEIEEPQIVLGAESGMPSGLPPA